MSDKKSTQPEKEVVRDQPQKQQDGVAALSSHEKDKLLNSILLESLKEQRLKRRWSTFFKFLLVFYFLILIYFWLSFKSDTFSFSPHLAKVSIKGAIMPDSQYSAANIIKGLKNAFKSDKVSTIILDINSPGGTVVQSDLVYREILALRKQYPNKKIEAVISDVGASGAYYIASATNEIAANRASMVGSIGVLYNGFGFVDTLKKLGIQRRLYTAGKYKGALDPFSPINDVEKKYLDNVLAQMHQLFIKSVIYGRGSRLPKQNYRKVFTGQIWTGIEAKQLGLIDKYSNIEQIRIHSAPKKIIDYTTKGDSFINLLAFENIFSNVFKSFFRGLIENIDLKKDTSYPLKAAI